MTNSKQNKASRDIYLLSDCSLDAFLKSGRGRWCAKRLGLEPSLALLKLVHIAALDEVPTLDPSKMHLTRVVLNLDLWSYFGGWELSCAGACLGFLAETKAIPLRKHRTRSGKKGQHYWIA
jgi:hypothetical protein